MRDAKKVRRDRGVLALMSLVTGQMTRIAMGLIKTPKVRVRLGALSSLVTNSSDGNAM